MALIDVLIDVMEGKIKIVIVGDGGTGKTALLETYSKREFPENYQPTVYEKHVVHAETSSKSKIELELWDTAGQEDFDRLRPLSYPNTDVFVICFSVCADSKSSFDNVGLKWVPEARHFCPNVPICLIGTRTDLRDTQKDLITINFEEGEQLAKKIGAEFYTEISAKKAKYQELEDLFKRITQTATKKQSKCAII